jgi:hypothetical protein
VRPLRYVPYGELGDLPNVVVDGSAAPSTRLVLSHWPGSATPAEVRDDLSAQIAFHALDRPALLEGLEVVSNNHFDQDGLVSVFALVEPDAALERRKQLIDVARAGDFGWFEERDSARIAIAIAHIDDYPDALPRFAEMLDHPDRFRSIWEAEDAHLDASLRAVDDGTIPIDEFPELDLAVVTVPESWTERAAHRFTMDWTAAVHPFAINNATDRFRILLVHGRRYRLECRYETWVQFVSRPVLPRPDLRGLAVALNEHEAVPTWTADSPGALTPMLRRSDDTDSSIAPEQLVADVKAWLAAAPPAWDPFNP